MYDSDRPTIDSDSPLLIVTRLTIDSDWPTITSASLVPG